ncbi:MAG: hypothetical protein CL393_10390, partial [Acidiferrobacteraceae bacterium]|nr:hypothetical protein [Acidiferrobacteraceae bacterium]
ELRVLFFNFDFVSIKIFSGVIVYVNRGKEFFFQKNFIKYFFIHFMYKKNNKTVPKKSPNIYKNNS